MLGVFVCWRALVRVTSRSFPATAATAAAAAAAPAPENFLEGVYILLPKEEAYFYFIALIGLKLSDIRRESVKFGAWRVQVVRYF